MLNHSYQFMTLTLKPNYIVTRVAKGAILLQRLNDNNFHPIFYYSHRTTDVESRYQSYEFEMLSIANTVKGFHIYLQGVHFKIVPDCNSVTLTLHKKDINLCIAR